MRISFRGQIEALGIAKLLQKFPDLRLGPVSDSTIKITGLLRFTAEVRGYESITDEFHILLTVAPNYPKEIPLVWEVAGRIPRTFHKLEGDALCLGSPTRLRLKIMNSPPLLSFVEQCVVPYLYGYCLHERGRPLPFGELSHGVLGLHEDLAALLGVRKDADIRQFAKLLSMRKRHANKQPCPCGSDLRVGRCHHNRLNALRRSLGRHWFSTLLR